MSRAPQETQSREREAKDHDQRFLPLTIVRQVRPLKVSAVQIILARKRYPQKGSKENVDELYELLAPTSVLHKVVQYTSVIRQPGKLDVEVRNCET